MKILVTGCAGFIGFHLTQRLLKDGHEVTGIDNLNDYYDVRLKRSRLSLLHDYNNQVDEKRFVFFQESIESLTAVENIFQSCQPECVVNLAAQAGVRYSIENPHAYIQSNINGFMNVLDCCRNYNIKHLLYASSSSVYGGNTERPFSELHNVDHPISIYAASKKANELMAHSYSHLFGLPTTGLRFFTVYGPWGRPDMALFKFTKSIIEDEPIDIYNNGDMIRDFTFIDDIIESIIRLLSKPPLKSEKIEPHRYPPSSSWAPFHVFNIGNNSPVPLMKYIESVEKSLSKSALKNFLPMQPGDVKATEADTTLLQNWISFKPATSIQYGVEQFITWYKEYYLK